MPTPASQTFSTPDAGSAAPWLRRAGKFGFWFFFIKGLCWLAVPGARASLGVGF